MAGINVVKLISVVIFILSLITGYAHTRDGESLSLIRENRNIDYFESNTEKENNSASVLHDLDSSKSSVAPNSQIPFLCQILQKVKFPFFIYSNQDPIRQCLLKLNISGFFYSKLYLSKSNDSSKSWKSLFGLGTIHLKHKIQLDTVPSTNNQTKTQFSKPLYFSKSTKRPLIRYTTPGSLKKSTTGLYPQRTSSRKNVRETTRQPYPWVTTRQPYPWLTTRQPYPWLTTRQPYPWETTRRPYPWDTTKNPYPWLTTRQPYPWETTRRPYPWETTRRPYPWETTRRPYPWETTRHPWDIRWTFEPWVPPIRDTSYFQPQYFLIVAGVFVGGSILGVMLRVCILNCGKEGLRRESADLFLHQPPESRTSQTYFAAVTAESTTGGIVNEGLSPTDKPPDYYTVTNSDGSVNRVSGANVYSPVISSQINAAPPPYEAVSPE